jgi:hypothetical protein
LCTDTHEWGVIFFGGRKGRGWGGADAGESWHEIADNLPDVMSVRAAAI